MPKMNMVQAINLGLSQEMANDDSVILLEDLLDVPGTVVPLWGSDHYLKSDWNLSQTLQRIIVEMTT